MKKNKVLGIARAMISIDYGNGPEMPLCLDGLIPDKQIKAITAAIDAADGITDDEKRELILLIGSHNSRYLDAIQNKHTYNGNTMIGHIPVIYYYGPDMRD